MSCAVILAKACEVNRDISPRSGGQREVNTLLKWNFGALIRLAPRWALDISGHATFNPLYLTDASTLIANVCAFLQCVKNVSLKASL